MVPPCFTQRLRLSIGKRSGCERLGSDVGVMGWRCGNEAGEMRQGVKQRLRCFLIVLAWACTPSGGLLLYLEHLNNTRILCDTTCSPFGVGI